MLRGSIRPGVILLLCLLLLGLPSVASAHERRDVGKLQFVVGFMVEPPLLGQPNGIDLRISSKDNNEPIEGAEKTLKASVAFGGNAPKEIPIRAVFGKKGAYTADLIPTRAGTYTFTFTGLIAENQVNEKFESGPGRFNDVQATAAFEYPEPAPYVGDLAKQVQTAEAQVRQATTYGMVGTALGVIGTLIGVASLLRKPRSA